MKKIENSECLIGFGKFIKEGRENKQLYQHEVAELAGISQAYYCLIERGERNVDLVLAMKLCRVLRLNLSDYIRIYMK